MIRIKALVAISLLTYSLEAKSVGTSSRNNFQVGVQNSSIVLLTPEMASKINEQMMKDEIAVVDIESEAFEIELESPPMQKKEIKDDIIFD